METSFFVTKERLIQLQGRMKDMPTARFVGNPMRSGDKFRVCLTLDTKEDIQTFTELSNSWYAADYSAAVKESLTFLEKVCDFFGW
jgi:spore coat polysaccharide biosynthesis protein SpsF (cytidylyltransferase family)